MKVALITPSNMRYMPYVRNYTNVMDENKIYYDLIIWDRIGEENPSDLIFKDKKKGIKRGFIDYLKYVFFIVRLFKKNDYQKVIIFSIQLTFFLQFHLLFSKYEYWIDVRDLHFFRRIIIKKVYKEAKKIVVSSKYYKKYVYNDANFIINHNTNLTDIYNIKKSKNIKRDKIIKISNIGSARDFEINKFLILQLSKNESYELYYHGAGGIEDKLNKFRLKQKINNVKFTGIYSKNEESLLYKDSTFINVLRLNDSLNNFLALPNRLYNAAIEGVPLLAIRGTKLAEIIEKYGLGLVLDDIKDVESKINYYIKDFNIIYYTTCRKQFLEEIIYDNEIYHQEVKKFGGGFLNV